MPQVSREEAKELVAAGKAKWNSDKTAIWYRDRPGHEILCNLCNLVDSKVTKHKVQTFGVRVQPDRQVFDHPDFEEPLVLTGPKDERKARFRVECEKRGLGRLELLNLD